MSQYIRKSMTSFLSGIVLGLPIYITVRDYICSVARVQGSSMQPTLNPRFAGTSDVVFLDNWNITYDSFKHGDIVAIVSPYDENVNFIKRIVGLEGDIVQTPRYKHDFVYIPKGHCWVEGDNSSSSLDSNSFGPVSLGLIKAKALYVLWPPSRWHKLEFKSNESRLKNFKV